MKFSFAACVVGLWSPILFGQEHQLKEMNPEYQEEITSIAIQYDARQEIFNSALKEFSKGWKAIGILRACEKEGVAATLLEGERTGGFDWISAKLYELLDSPDPRWAELDLTTIEFLVLPQTVMHMKAAYIFGFQQAIEMTKDAHPAQICKVGIELADEILEER